MLRPVRDLYALISPARPERGRARGADPGAGGQPFAGLRGAAGLGADLGRAPRTTWARSGPASAKGFRPSAIPGSRRRSSWPSRSSLPSACTGHAAVAGGAALHCPAAAPSWTWARATPVTSGVGYVGIALAGVIAITTGGHRPDGACLRRRCAVGRHRLRPAECRQQFRLRHHLADRAPHLRGRLDRGQRQHGDRQGHLRALHPDRDLRQDRRDRAQRRFHLGHGDELDTRQRRGTCDHDRGRGLRHRHAPGGRDPAGDRRGPSAGRDHPAAGCGFMGFGADSLDFRDPRDLARREQDPGRSRPR